MSQYQAVAYTVSWKITGYEVKPISTYFLVSLS